MKKIGGLGNLNLRVSDKKAEDFISSGGVERPAQPESSEPTKRLNMDIPVSVHRQIKVKAANMDMSIKDYVLGLINKDLP